MKAALLFSIKKKLLPKIEAFVYTIQRVYFSDPKIKRITSLKAIYLRTSLRLK